MRLRIIHDERGAVYVEFLLAFIPFFIMFVGMVQMALLYAADLVVQHAAVTAARSASVVLDDDPSRYDDAPRREISMSGGGRSSEDMIGTVLGFLGGGGGGGGSPGGTAGVGGPRLGAIRTAASVPLMAVSPSFNQLVRADSIRTAIGGEPALRGANGASLYNRAAMAVTFPTAPRATSYRTRFRHGDQITTRVTYLFHCAIPLASRLMCESYPTLRLGPAAAAIEEFIGAVRDGSMSLDEAFERINRINTARERYQAAQPGMQELEAAGLNDLMYLSWASGARFKVLRSEATMPLFSARYEYR